MNSPPESCLLLLDRRKIDLLDSLSDMSGLHISPIIRGDDVEGNLYFLIPRGNNPISVAIAIESPRSSTVTVAGQTIKVTGQNGLMDVAEIFSLSVEREWSDVKSALEELGFEL